MSEREILPCPFCGSGLVRLMLDYVWCKDCDAQGPRSLGAITEAIAAWNAAPRKEHSQVDCSLCSIVRRFAGEGEACALHRKWDTGQTP